SSAASDVYKRQGQGWYEARREGPEYSELRGSGLSEADALDDLRERIEASLSQADHYWKSIGSNDAGEFLEENTLGIRLSLIHI
ncbi:hypothetical protein, partial [Pseudomonas paraeruginosa]|uniref:hypothetical protein n=1 Tax=Pseudomonas paraeruginosa TaxID=2994495 RepID=UPI003A4C729B